MTAKRLTGLTVALVLAESLVNHAWAQGDTCLPPIPIPAVAQSVTFNPLNRMVYTANRSQGTVSLISADTLQVVRTVGVTPSPVALVPNPINTSGKVYVGGDNGLPPYVDAIYPFTNAISRIVLPPGTSVVTHSRSFSLAMDIRQNRIWFGNGIGPVGDVSVIDGATDRVLTRFVVHFPGDDGGGVIPQALAFNPRNNKAYVLGYGRGADQFAQLTIFDGTSFGIIRQFSPLSLARGSGFPSSIFYNPVNNKVYCGLFEAGVVIIDGATDQVLATIPVRGSLFTAAFNPDRNVAYLTDYLTGMVYVIDGTTNELINTISGVEGALGLAYNTATRKLYVLATTLDRLIIIHGATDQIVGYCPTERFAAGIENNEGATIVADPETGRTFFTIIAASGSGSLGVVAP